jgi:hypothetical protein
VMGEELGVEVVAEELELGCRQCAVGFVGAKLLLFAKAKILLQ